MFLVPAFAGPQANTGSSLSLFYQYLNSADKRQSQRLVILLFDKEVQVVLLVL